MKITKYNKICDKYKKQLETYCKCIPYENCIIGDLPNIFPSGNVKLKQTECELLHSLYTNCLIFQKKKNE